MRPIKIRVFFILTAVFLFAASSVSQAQHSFKPISPDLEARIRQLQKDVAAKGNTFTVGYSSAMERSIDQLTGFKPELEDHDNIRKMEEAVPLLLKATTLPKSYNWRLLGGVTPIKDQGNCGDCWAFGTVAPLEAQLKIKCGLTVDLSEQYLTSCNVENWGCHGGYWAHNYHMNKIPPGQKAAGAVLESAFPYVASDAPCWGTYTHPYKIASWAYITGQPIPSVRAIKQAIYTHGPVGAAVHVGPKFQAYSGGIFNANESGKVNHAIALVGWVDDIGPDKGYWILRNSWGTSWGESGYMRIRYGMSQVGRSANYVVLSACPPSPPPTPSLPDLKGAWSQPVVTNRGGTVSATLSIYNVGKVKAGPFAVSLWLSVNGVSKDSLLGNSSISGIAAGQKTTIAFNKSRASGTYSGLYFIAIIDSNSSVKESSETNNRVTVKIP